MDKRVEIHGTGRADLNGQRGAATDFHLHMQDKTMTNWRYTVKLDSGEAFKFKVANVRVEGAGAIGGGVAGAGNGKAKGEGGRAGPSGSKPKRSARS